jgi:hydroxypyruvate isomerase
MLRFSANLSFLFGEVAFLERFGAARAAGFDAVEFAFAYDHEAEDIAGAAREAGVQVVLINLPPGDLEAGERGLAGVPGREKEFAEALATAIHYAGVLGCPRIHAMAGVVPEGATPEDCEATFAANLAMAAAHAADRDLKVMIEPINRLDMPGYILSYQDQARRIIKQVGAQNLRLQFDAYHCQIMEGDLARKFERLLPLIGHVQIADNPGRHEPGTGEINYGFLLRYMERLGYAGWIGCEYKPEAGTEQGLGWLAPFRGG